MNAINQNITPGDNGYSLSLSPRPPGDTWGLRDVFNIGTSYAWTKQWKLTANFEYVRGLDTITSPPPPA